MVKEIDKQESPESDDPNSDRPDWIPEHISENWDPNPYAYQTEEELMPQGPLHARLLIYIAQVLPGHLRQFGAMFWADLFLLFRDSNTNIKKRIGPDILLSDLDIEFKAGSWDLDQMPVPEFVSEITSPDSRKSDLETKPDLYHGLGIGCYLVIDGYDHTGEVSGVIQTHLWQNGQKQNPNQDGFHEVPELHIKVKAEARELEFYDLASSDRLLDSDDKDQRIRELEEKLRKLED